MLLSKETFHRFNRILLLSIIMLSFLLPFIEVTMQKMPEMTVFFLLLEEAMETYETQHLDVLAETPNRFPWNTLIFSVYLSGTLFFLLRHAWSIGRMLCLLRTCRKEEREDGITLYIHQAKVAPFSWMKLMAISEEDLEKHSEAILAHERAHIRNHHSWDLLLAQACVFLQWFNPAAWLLKKELQTIHEYEADEYVIRNGMDASTYLLSMIEKTVGTRLFTIANNFNQSLLAKRVTMLNKAKSRPWARLKYLYIFPTVALSVVVFAQPPIDVLSYSFLNSEGLPTTVKMKRTGAFTSSMKDSILVVIDEKMQGYGLKVLDSISGELIQTVMTMQSEFTVDEYGERAKHGAIKITTKKNATTTSVKEKLIFQTVEEMPEFPGGMDECKRFFGKNIKYPTISQENGVQGRVIVQFVVNGEGAIVDPVVTHGVDPYLDKEALRVISMMPKWKPGKQRGKPVNVMLSFPVTFHLQ
jgi:TonB family protein